MKDKTILEMYLEDMKNIKPLDEAKKMIFLKLCVQVIIMPKKGL